MEHHHLTMGMLWEHAGQFGRDKNQKQKQLIVLMERLLQNNYPPCCQGIIQIQCKMILLTIKMIEMIKKNWKLEDLNTVIKLEN